MTGSWLHIDRALPTDDFEIVANLQRTDELLANLASSGPGWASDLIRRLYQAATGPRAQRYDPTGIRSRTATPPDPDADEVLATLADLRTHAAAAFTALAKVHEIWRNHPPAAPRPTLEPTENQAEHCTNCARLQLHAGKPWLCRQQLQHGTVGGRLHLPVTLCAWCRKRVRETAPEGVRLGRLPGVDRLHAHRQATLATTQPKGARAS